MTAANRQDWTKVTACGLYPASRLAGHDSGDAPDPMQVEICRSWLRRHAEPTERIHTRVGSSYTLKHVVEAWTEERGPYHQVDALGRHWTGPYHYVSNGAFIEAARLEGYRIQRGLNGSPNAFFNMKIARQR